MEVSGLAEIEAVFHVHYEAVRRYCLSRTASPEEAEDAAQDTFIRFLEKAGVDHPNPQAWLIRAAGWACSDLRRRKWGRVATGLSDDAALSNVSSVEEVAVDAMVVRDLLREMRPSDAGLLRAVYLEGESVAAVARARGLPEGRVRMMLMRARRRAREAVGALNGLAALGLNNVLRRLRQLCAGDGPARITVGGTATVGLAVALVFLPSTAGSPRSIARAAPPPAPARSALAAAFAPLVQPGDTPAAGSVAGASPRSGAGRTTVAATATLPPIVDPGANATSHNSRFDYIVPSPDYAVDGTVFAMGRQQQDCTACLAVLFRSQDFGHSWQNLHADSLGYGPVFVSPTYAQDRTVFVLNSSGLQQSTDGGESFSPTLVRTPAALGAIASSPPGGSSRVAFLPATGGPWQLLYYDSGAQSVGVGPLLPPDLQPSSVAFGQDEAHVLVGGKAQLTGDSEVADCIIGAATCTEVTLPSPAPKMDTWVRVVRALAAGSASTVLAYTPWTAYVSTDSGASFQPLIVPVEAGLAGIDPAPGFASNRTVLVASLAGGSNNADTLTEGTVSGGTFSQLSQASVPGALDSEALLADGNIVASRYSITNPTLLGLACSMDAGQTWQAAC